MSVSAVKTFLQKLGSFFTTGAAKALQIEAALAPAAGAVESVVAASNPGAAVGINTFNAILGSVVGVEQVATAVGASSGTGAQKLVAAVPGVEQAILSNPLFAGKTPANLALYNSALTAITSSVADLLNSFGAGTTVTSTPAT
jgi:hypothetical protein